MRTRRWLTWLVFAVCALAVLEGLGWVSWRAIKAERSEASARAQAAFQESVRLALWRMESEVTPIIAQESVRPYFHYRSFYAAKNAYTRMWREVEAGEVQVPSPLLEHSGQFIRLHFQVEPGGEVTSPQAPTGNMLDLAESKRYVEPEFIALSTHLLDDLRQMLVQHGRAEASRDEERAARLEQAQVAQAPEPQQAGGFQEQFRKDQAALQKELVARQQAYQTANAPIESTRKNARSEAPASTPAAPTGDGRLAAATPPPPTAEKQLVDTLSGDAKPVPTYAAKDERASPVGGGGGEGLKLKSVQGGPAPEVDVEQSPFNPRWRRNGRTGEDELVVERTVRLEGQRYVQGFWMDWPALRAKVLAAAADLLPRAELRPIPPSNPGAPQSPLEVYRLASIPVYLVPGQAPAVAAIGLTATHATLIVTWLAVLAAIAAIAIVLRTAMELGDRRGRFVSAVTHELRTPLTTFCLYTEMLADGIVREESQRRDYMGTLKAESRRLAGIVENVLEYARLGGAPHRNGHAPIGAADLLAQVVPALERCTRQGGMELVRELEDPGPMRVAADPRTVERVLLNLVENACKYAGEGAGGEGGGLAASDRRLHLIARPGKDRGRPVLEVIVRDHGPGVPGAEQRQIFQPFRRGKREAETAKSGLGLGLALSRGLARGLGGELSMRNHPEGGAEFRFIIPAHGGAAGGG